MKIGIRNGSLKMDCIEAAAAAGKLGYDSVELDIGADYADTLPWQAEGRAKLRRDARDKGCGIASICVGALWKISPANRDAAVRAEAGRVIGTSAAVAAELGAKWILLPVTPGGEEVDHEECVQRWIEEISKVASAAADNGVFFCLENVGGGCGKSADDLLRLVQGIGSPAVGVYYDIGNAVAFGNDPNAEIRQLKDVTRIVHVKDHGDLLGTGDVPIPDALRTLKGVDYDDYLILETAATDDPMQAGAFNLGYLRGALAAI